MAHTPLNYKARKVPYVHTVVLCTAQAQVLVSHNSYLASQPYPSEPTTFKPGYCEMRARELS